MFTNKGSFMIGGSSMLGLSRVFSTAVTVLRDIEMRLHSSYI